MLDSLCSLPDTDRQGCSPNALVALRQPKEQV